MKDVVRSITAVSIALSILSLTSVLLYTGNNDINRQANAQPTTQNPFPNNTETVEAFENILGDQNAHIIINGTNIANPDNTLPDSININIKEDCIKLPNSVHLYCP
ncbi:MAG TPA: hypothetical protein VFY41_05270 [Nitrososphaeraceae archaeon]|nr:hypothetical protein [Nitrososphaeraceae archaeon]